MPTRLRPASALRRGLVLTALLLLGLAGCSNPDGPVRPAGSIDIPASTLKNREAAGLSPKVQAQIKAQQDKAAAAPASAPASH